MSKNFDKHDLRIMSMLASNARKPYLEIARECGVSGAAVHQRVQRLQARSASSTRPLWATTPVPLSASTCATRRSTTRLWKT